MQNTTEYARVNANALPLNSKNRDFQKLGLIWNLEENGLVDFSVKRINHPHF
jgi:hypothetical protein